MLRRSIVSVFALIFALLAGAAIATAELVFPMGQRIGLEPPPGMSLSRRFPGFEDPAHKAGIATIALPVQAYEGLERAMFGEASPGFTIDKRQTFPFRDGIGFLITGVTREHGTTIDKWFLLARATGQNSDFTAFITMEVPIEARAVYPDKVIRAALASVTFRPAPLAEQIAMMPFKLGRLPASGWCRR